MARELAKVAGAEFFFGWGGALRYVSREIWRNVLRPVQLDAGKNLERGSPKPPGGSTNSRFKLPSIGTKSYSLFYTINHTSPAWSRLPATSVGGAILHVQPVLAGNSLLYMLFICNDFNFCVLSRRRLFQDSTFPACTATKS